MDPEQAKTSESVAADVDTLKRLPEKAKELLLLQDDAQKASGPEEVALNKKIADKSGSETHAGVRPRIVRDCR